jgi:hypothetical protein
MYLIHAQTGKVAVCKEKEKVHISIMGESLALVILLNSP